MTRPLLRRLLPAVALVGVLAVALTQCGSDDPPPPSTPWADGSVHGSWESVFNGHGTNSGDDDSLTLSPMPAEDPGTTHAGLVVSTASYADVRFTARMRTVEQLREPDPNPWEVPWLVWAYTDAELQQLEQELVASIAPDAMLAFMRWMLPAVSPEERCEFLEQMSQGAPPHVVRAVIDAAALHLPAGEAETLVLRFAPPDVS